MNKFSLVYRKWTSISLVLRILVGLALGILLGFAVPTLSGIGILGVGFVSALKAIAPILVAVLVTASIAKAKGGLGRRFGLVIALYLFSTFVAAVVAVVGSNLFPVTLTFRDAADGSAPEGLAEVFSGLLTNMVQNPVAAVASANYIGILFWSIIIGIALRKYASAATVEVIDNLAKVVSTVVGWVIQFAPFGIMGLVFTAVSESGLEIFTEYGRLVLLLVGCMAFVALVTNPLIVALITRRNPYPMVWRCLKESGLSAFFTRSSAANIPVNMDLCKRMGLDENFYSVSIPLGATINMNGAAVTITVLSLAVAGTMGVNIGILPAIVLSAIATLGACGTSGVAGGSLLLVPMACAFFGVGNDVAMQAVGVGFIIGVIQDSVETALNSSGDVLFTATAEMQEKRRK
ncbi:MAG: serine/threonine transporter SstT [Bacteroidales bacterium]|nr:serine/threonine transporter SstT [Bacteroidales bacterium]